MTKMQCFLFFNFINLAWGNSIFFFFGDSRYIIRFFDMPHVWRLLLLWDWFCYQKWVGLNDVRCLSSGGFAVRDGVTRNSAGSPVALSGLAVGLPLAHLYLWIFSGAERLRDFQLLSQWNTFKTRLIWVRALQDLQPSPCCLKWLTGLEMWMVAGT